MVNAKAKGNRRERQAKERLEDDGWAVYRPPNSRYQDTDIFNLFDLVATKPTKRFKYVQVKSNVARAKSDYATKALDIMPLKHCDVEMWCFHDYQGWRILKLTDDGEWKTLLDQR